MAETSFTLDRGTVLGDRYRIVRQIGQGGFGRTYLAEDIYRYDEYCVLKEFAPIVEGDTTLRKAEELFEREAGILYQLKHPQIPQFKALLRTQIYNKRTLFLVQEYILGKTYDQLLQSEGKFTESKILRLMSDILPTLEYIHQQKLIHRDISPDNLIFRKSDKKPVLIDFGCVKLAANAISRSQGYGVTLIGKKGYAPEEQMRDGIAFANSDLYALAVTVIVLLTGKSPDELYNNYQGKWQWEKEVNVSSGLTKIINKMLSYRPCDRYSNASEVLNALNHNNLSVTSIISRIQTFIVAPKNSFVTNSKSYQKTTQQFVRQVNRNISRIKTVAVTNRSKISRQITNLSFISRIRPRQWGLIVSSLVLISGCVGFITIFPQNKLRPLSLTKRAVYKTFLFLKTRVNPSASATLEEQTQQQNIYQRIQALNIDSGAFYNSVDREFYRQYPELKGITLTNSKKHQKYRLIWYQIAEQLLAQKEKNI